MKQNALIAGFVGLVILLVGGGIVYKIRSIPQPVAKKIEAPLSEPIVRITDPQRGNENAPLTIVYFSDFGCESCAAADPILDQLQKDFKDQIRFVWKDLPSHKNIYPESYELHKAARCAATTGKFWEFHKAAFLHIKEIQLHTPVLEKTITEAGLNSESILKCMQSFGIISAINENEHEAKLLSITATPTFFIGDTRYEGMMPYYQFAGTIRNKLAQMTLLK